MKRILVGITAACLATIAGAATPPVGGAPVTVQNTPLGVSLTTIPQEMDQRRPIDVQIVGNNAAVDLGQVRSNFLNLPCNATKASQGSGSWVECDAVTFSPPPPAAPWLIRMITFMPGSFSEPPSTDPAGLSCQATVFLSRDGGSTYSRVLDTMWSPPHFAPSHITLPVPIFVQPGIAVTGKVRLWIVNGPGEAGCRVRALLWATRQ